MYYTSLLIVYDINYSSTIEDPYALALQCRIELTFFPSVDEQISAKPMLQDAIAMHEKRVVFFLRQQTRHATTATGYVRPFASSV